ncbi:hypothetical protein [Rubripirellula reticaptiva]|uniref:DUF4292 domain-containing protein n=1 Tax=Rubripirellula reticaptiva TaxID=2528013 RepID=A0A5C6ES30_9BACT|nr:hypothetical protein [Rubripirellula reticaptiva]TWU51130.1 hypothetical protein Poly59_27190 [Rubripirellula reticaptiva]
MRAFGTIAMGFVLFVSGGATCARRPAPLPFPPAPVVFNETPTLQEVASVVNRTASVQQLSTNSASVEMLSMPSLPRLSSATMNLQRDRNLRLRASIPILLGMGLDMGSNDEVFWFEVPEDMSKKLYYANHQQYKQQLDRAILPVDPTWIMDALGLAQIDPATVIAGPIALPDGKLQVRSTIPSPSGNYQRDLFIHPKAGYITDQFLYNPLGRLVAQSQASNHKYYDAQQCALPHRVDINLVPTVGPPLTMRIEVSDYTVNQLLSGDPNLFTMPTSASRSVDLTTLSAASPGSLGMASPSANYSAGPSEYSAEAPTAYPIRGTFR